MGEKVYLVNGEELAGFARIKQNELLSVIKETASANPSASIKEVLNQVQEWFLNGELTPVEWDYSLPYGVKEEEVSLLEEDFSYEEENYDSDLPEFFNDSETDETTDSSDEETLEELNSTPVDSYGEAELNLDTSDESEPVVYDLSIEEDEEDEDDIFKDIDTSVVLSSDDEEFVAKNSNLVSQRQDEEDRLQATAEAYKSANEEELFPNQTPPVNRKRRWQGLLNEVSKLEEEK